MKILVVGTAGSGKTTIAASLSQSLSIPNIELDALYWGPDWKPPDRGDFQERVRRLLAEQPAWVIDGNYRSVRATVAEAADVIVWLDYPLVRTQWRLARRTFARVVGREVLWNDNRESARMVIASRLELFRWAASEHRRLRTEIPELSQSRAADRVIRIRLPADTADLLARLGAMATTG